MDWRLGLVALMFVGTAAAQGIGLPTIPGTGEIPIPTVTLPVIPGPGETPEPGAVPGLDPSMIPDPALPAFRIPAGSSEPGAPLQEYQHAIWRDGEHLGDVPREGYDLVELRAWEVDEMGVGAGMLLRLEVAGNALAGSQYVIEGRLVVVETDLPSSVLLWTEDGTTWESDDIIIAQASTQSAIPGLPSARHHVIHVLVTYDGMEAEVGQSLRDWTFSSFTDTAVGVQLADIAPGGYLLTPDVELPEPNSAGMVDDESLSETATEPPRIQLRGAGQHIGISGAWEAGVATMTIYNPYLETEQFIALAYPAEATPVNGTNGTVAPNATLELQFMLPRQTAAYTASWDVRSDIGGVAQVQVMVPAIPPPTPTAPEPEPEPEPVPLERTDPVVAPPSQSPTPTATPTATPTPQDGGEDSPGLGPVLLLAVLAIAVAIWRKR